VERSSVTTSVVTVLNGSEKSRAKMRWKKLAVLYEVQAGLGMTLKPDRALFVHRFFRPRGCGDGISTSPSRVAGRRLRPVRGVEITTLHAICLSAQSDSPFL